MKRLDARARTTEVDDTSDRLLVLYNDETALAEDTFLKPLFGEMQTLSEQITEAIKRDRILSAMEDADAEVETATRALNAVLKGYSAMPLDLYSTAGKALYDVMAKYKLKILRLNYADQSSNIEALLMDLAAPALQPNLAKAYANRLAELRRALDADDGTEVTLTYDWTDTSEKNMELYGLPTRTPDELLGSLERLSALVATDRVTSAA